MSISFKKVNVSVDKSQVNGITELVFAEVDRITATHSSRLPDGCQFSRWVMPKKYTTVADRIYDLQVRPDDVFVVSFPKSGNTWMMNIVWQLMNGLNLAAKTIDDGQTLERSMLFDVDDELKRDPAIAALCGKVDRILDDYEQRPSPRLLKSHLAADLLPKGIWTVKPKVIYVYRDAKDVAVSMYHMTRNHMFYKYRGTMEDFFDMFLNDRIIWGPFHEHLNSFRQLHGLEHVFLISYEEMLADSFAAIKNISEFLGYSYSCDQLKQLTQHVSFENLRENFDDSKMYSNGHKYEFVRMQLFNRCDFYHIQR